MAEYVERLDPDLKFRREASEVLAAWVNPDSVRQIDIFRPATAEGAAFAEVWATSRAHPGQVAVDDSEIIKSMAMRQEYAELVKLGGTRRSWRVHVPLGRDGAGGAKGLLRVHCDMDRWSAVWRSYLAFAMKMLLAVVPLEFALLWVLTSAYLRRPMQKLLSAMQSLGGGDTTARANIWSRDELGSIATRFDAMADELQKTGQERDTLLEDVRGLNASLQGRVDDALLDVRAKNAALERMVERISILREELGQQERLAVAGQLTAAFAHEIGTPLNLVDGHLQLLLGEPSTDEGIREHLATIHAQIGRVGDIVKRLLGHTRPVEPKKAPLKLAPLLFELGQLWAPALGSRRVSLSIDIPEDCTLMADRRQIEQVLINLVNNAADAMEGGGSISLSCSRHSDGGWEVSVADTGQGISKENLGSVFKPMFTTKPEGNGTGLGLAICRAIVRAHGGEMEIESETGRGTTVRFVLPGHVPQEDGKNLP
jgi:two-component system NtrC family sensor kinase